jgi:hypothetical protein
MFLKKELMKKLSIILLLLAGSAIAIEAPAQTSKQAKKTTTKVTKSTGAQSSNASTTGKIRSTNKGANGNHYGQQQNGNSGRAPVAQHHGPKDVTPGSPVGTGGAGGGNMSGSPAGSAIETKDQTSKAAINTNGQPNNAARPKAKPKKTGRKS